MTESQPTVTPQRVSVRCLTLRQGERFSEWQRLIHQVNRLCKVAALPALFGAPDSTGDWWAGGEVEEYLDARVIHRGDGSVSIASKTDRGAHFIRLAAADLDIVVQGV
jgi:hypothetical protein